MDRTKEFLEKHRYLPSDLVSIRTAEIAVRKAVIIETNKINVAKQCLHILGEAYRGDWGDCDGRELREQLSTIINILAGSELTVEEFMENNLIVEDEKYKGIYKWKG